MSKKGLGRGLGALIPEVDLSERERQGVVELEIGQIVPNPAQPRRDFDPDRLEELAASIREHGIVQPIVVRQVGQGYEIIAGERRWRAAKQAGLSKVPALVREFTDAERMEIALIENLQREDLNPLEEAEAYRTLMETFGLTQEALAKRLGRSRPQVANTLRLLHLPQPVQEEVRSGRLSMGHAKVLLGVEDAADRIALAERAVREQLSVRQLEELVQRRGSAEKRRTPVRQKLPPDLAAIERRLREQFGTPVKLRWSGDRGRVEITFFGEEGLGRLLDALGMSGQQPVLPRPPREPFRV
ncbi:ParB family chromosome partitioning protein [Symbiobacterium terraclitae]|uniref:ParB family chromosome partitioning protein n=1 Tax=Symbiobacterium terraclitae TaxID=557451 RepID=A0ABS4JVF8_9FIRM|nr:ParB family chromosome partitioning protein [Symbiobacterium terraclitae]